MEAKGGKAENMLYYGDNLEILRQYVDDESVQLVYLDPPFKSNQAYNVLFAEKNGSQSAAQIMAFEDTWHWDSVASSAYQEVVTSGGRVAEAMEAFKRFLGQSDMMAYLSMMAPRLIELRRVLKPTGSIYLHCDSTASHYLKILMDSIFGPENFLNDIVWKRATTVKGNIGQGSRFFGPNTDNILFYRKTERNTFNGLFKEYSEDYVEQFFRYVEPGTGRRYRLISMTGPGGAAKGNPQFEVMGITRYWRYSKESMAELIKQGLVVQTSPGAVPQRKQYLDEGKGVAVQSLWDDIPPLQSQAKERLGYPTQKPETLLERIIRASSNEGDLVLDPFCGCGTTISVAQRLNRRWIGIDITHLAITLMKVRLKDAFGDSVVYSVIGEPRDLAGAINLAKKDKDMHQFQWWALSLVGARPAELKKGADKGIDGKLRFFVEPGKAEQVIFSVKGGHVTVAHVRELAHVVAKEKAAIGVLISLEEPTGPMRAEAADAGFYISKELGNPKYQKIQLLTIEQLLSGKKVDCPASVYHREANPTFKKAPKAKREPKQKEKQSKLSEHSS